jgi:hypothetical protein
LLGDHAGETAYLFSRAADIISHTAIGSCRASEGGTRAWVLVALFDQLPDLGHCNGLSESSGDFKCLPLHDGHESDKEGTKDLRSDQVVSN